jgi:CRISPR/Cas system Type II protein with McrA/HNH and RuvC-like nuclease domain
MPAPTPSYAKNMIYRSLREIVDPSPKKADVERIWKFFDYKCAYCGKPLRKLHKEGHIDHLFPASLGGPNQISNRVLSCATCNEAEKLDGAWQEFILRKNNDPEVVRTRIAKIHEWQKLNGKPVLDKNKLRDIERLSESAAAYYDVKVKEARKLRYS